MYVHKIIYVHIYINYGNLIYYFLFTATIRTSEMTGVLKGLQYM